MYRAYVALLTVLFLSGCSGLPFPLGGGPSVNTNAQVGAENTQQVVAQQTNQDAGRDIVAVEVVKEVEADTVETVVVTNNYIPPWVILVLILGWLLPTPQQIGRGIFNSLKGLTRAFRWTK